MLEQTLAGEWLKQGLCVGDDAEMWIAPGDLPTTQRLKRICAECPVKEQCLEYALDLPERETMGVWGGTSERERRKIRMFRNRRRREEDDGAERATG